jgi:hypothetical protein
MKSETEELLCEFEGKKAREDEFSEHRLNTDDNEGEYNDW